MYKYLHDNTVSKRKSVNSLDVHQRGTVCANKAKFTLGGGRQPFIGECTSVFTDNVSDARFNPVVKQHRACDPSNIKAGIHAL